MATFHRSLLGGFDIWTRAKMNRTCCSQQDLYAKPLNPSTLNPEPSWPRLVINSADESLNDWEDDPHNLYVLLMYQKP